MIQTGKGTIPVIKLIAIYSISALVCLCGLAISPIFGVLKEIFHATDVEIQTITSLPALLMIPTVIVSGKLTEKKTILDRKRPRLNSRHIQKSRIPSSA